MVFEMKWNPLGAVAISPEPTAVGAVCSAAAVRVAGRRRLNFLLWTTAGYHLFFSAISAFRRPWAPVHDLDQSIPILAGLVSTLSLIGVGVFFAWQMPGWHKVFQRYFTH
jgi:hypothetical protein